ncbi:MAG: L,D-transpeptidase family protein [Variovorax sp.]
MNRRTLARLFWLGVTLIASACSTSYEGLSDRRSIQFRPPDRRTVADAVQLFGPMARSRLAADFTAAGASYPPPSITLLAIKDAALLELWVGSEAQPTYIKTYQVRALSGGAGPKLREGDGQVPEGIYRIESLNPNSAFHLSLKLDYPNAFDRATALLEARDEPGSDIFIHGSASSIGCLAMGDVAIEELFVLTSDTGRDNVRVVIAPSDPRRAVLAPRADLPWTLWLYELIDVEFRKYPRATSATAQPSAT